MKTLASMTLAGIAMACAVVLSNPGRAAPRDMGVGTLTAAAFDGAVIHVAGTRADTVELSAQQRKSGKKGSSNKGAVFKGGNQKPQAKRGGQRGNRSNRSNRGHHNNGGRDAAIAAGMIGIIGGLIAADQQGNVEGDGYYDDEPPPPPRYRGRDCPYGTWVDRDGYEHCRR